MELADTFKKYKYVDNPVGMVYNGQYINYKTGCTEHDFNVKI